MARRGIITDISLGEFKERVPRIDQRARIALKSLDLLYQNARGNIWDLVAPSERRDDESRMGYVHRRASERHDDFAPTIESFVLDKGFGTETTRAMIRHRQAHPDPYPPQQHKWVP